MEPVENVYKGGFFKNRHRLNWRVDIVCNAIEGTFSFKKIIDVGCAIGDYVLRFHEKGYFSYGIEGSKAAVEFIPKNIIDKILIFDIRKQLSAKPEEKLDLCYSLEVAEHIDPKYADQYIDNLCFLSDSILLTAAGPGQDGHGHVNCQPPEYWEEKFKERNYFRLKNKEQIFKMYLEPWKHKKGLNAYYKNCMIFKEIK